MLIGRTPFEGEREQAVLYGIVQEEPEPITSQRSAGAVGVGLGCLEGAAKDKEERYPHIDDMLVDLRAVARQVAEASDTARPGKRPTTKVRREAPARARGKRLAWALGIAAAAVVLTMAGMGVRNFLPTTEAPLEPLRPVPLTSYPGFEAVGSFSPDGNQVAFAWTGGNRESFDIYVKVVGPGPPLRLTTHSRHGWQPRLVAGRPLDRLSPRTAPSRKENGPIPDFPSWREGAETGGDAGSWELYSGELSGLVSRQHLAGRVRLGGGFARAVERILALGGFRRKAKADFAARRLDHRRRFARLFSRRPHARLFPLRLRLSSDLYLLDLDQDLNPQGEPRRRTFIEQVMGGHGFTSDGRDIVFAAGSLGAASLWRVPTSGTASPSGCRLGRAESGRNSPVRGIGSPIQLLTTTSTSTASTCPSRTA